jgi:DNA-binding LacI/PurR family transcriptional regulator
MPSKKKNLTIRDIAKLADVSYQTVSNVINNKTGVSDKTRKRILRLMEEQDYRPNKAAQTLSTSRSNTLELIYVDVNYGGRLADSTKDMAHAAEKAGYSLLVSVCGAENLEIALNRAASRLVDGIVMHAPSLRIDDDELLIMCNGIPIVRRDYTPGSRLAWVGFDQVYATRLAVEHLIHLGHRQIAAVPPESAILNGYWRYITLKNILLEHGLTPGPVVAGDYTTHGAYNAANKVIESGEVFTAIVVGTDNMAIGVMAALREHGLQVPHDVSIISYDNTEIAPYLDPPLTSIDFKFVKQEEIAIQYLLDIIAEPDMDLHQHVLMPDIIIRSSTRNIGF